MDKVFAISNLVLCVMAGLSYAYSGDIRRTAYWLAAAVIVAAVTF